MAWKKYWTARVGIEFNGMYALAQRAWYAGLKPEAEIEEKLMASVVGMINETKPQLETGESYADYQGRIDAWKDDIQSKMVLIRPILILNISQLMNGTKDEDKQKSLVNMVDRITKKMNYATVEEYTLKNDSVLQAIDNVWYENYFSAFWDAMGDLTGDARDLAEREFNRKHPRPTLEDVWAWISKKYGTKFTKDEVKAGLEGREVFTVEDRLETGMSDSKKIADDIWNILSWIKTPEQREAMREALIRQGVDDGWMDSWYDFAGDVDTWGDVTKIQQFYAALLSASKTVGLTSPTDAELLEHMEATELQTKFITEVEEATGGDEGKRIRALYWYMDNARRKVWRTENPEQYAMYITAYYDLRDQFAALNPLWAKYYYPDYDPDNLYGSGFGSGSGSGGGSNGYSKSYGSYGYSRSYYGKKSSGPEWIPAYRSTLDARKLLKKYL